MNVTRNGHEHTPSAGPRVLQLAGGYLPWTIGGKEVYVHQLSRYLLGAGWNVRAVFHQNLNHDEPIGAHVQEGVPLTVLPAVTGQDRRTAVYSCLPSGVPGFEALLDEFQPDVVHLHDFSITINLLHLRAARRAGARVVMTYHSPGQSCLQRSLLYRGRTVCDGEILPGRCTECRLGVTGVPRPIARAIAALPALTSDPDVEGLFARVTTARTMTERFIDAWREMLTLVDRVQVHADWAAELMRKNGVRPGQLAMVRLGVPRSLAPVSAPASRRDRTLRVAYIGRCDEVKGVDVLIEAVKALPRDLPVQVSFFGPYWTTRYAQGLLSRMEGDARFERPLVVANSKIPGALAAADVCVIPSVWLETGPIVMLEAFDAGVPVVASRLGGMAEIVRDGVDGLLFEPGRVPALSAILRELAEHPARLAALREGVRKPRTMADLGRETAQVYDELLGMDAMPLAQAQ